MEEAGWIIKLDFESVKRMFDPVVDRIIKLIDGQLNDVKERCCAIFLVAAVIRGAIINGLNVKPTHDLSNEASSVHRIYDELDNLNKIKTVSSSSRVFERHLVVAQEVDDKTGWKYETLFNNISYPMLLSIFIPCRCNNFILTKGYTINSGQIIIPAEIKKLKNLESIPFSTFAYADFSNGDAGQWTWTTGYFNLIKGPPRMEKRLIILMTFENVKIFSAGGTSPFQKDYKGLKVIELTGSTFFVKHKGKKFSEASIKCV
ncbi:hypothetical protein RhiirB3_532674 [Rhizophagus irregularis]|nr:hypothetical protein RhiirB3_532674 [Rhizophagus irregularis]